MRRRSRNELVRRAGQRAGAGSRLLGAQRLCGRGGALRAGHAGPAAGGPGVGGATRGMAKFGKKLGGAMMPSVGNMAKGLEDRRAAEDLHPGRHLEPGARDRGEGEEGQARPRRRAQVLGPRDLQSQARHRCNQRRVRGCQMTGRCSPCTSRSTTPRTSTCRQAPDRSPGGEPGAADPVAMIARGRGRARRSSRSSSEIHPGDAEHPGRLGACLMRRGRSTAAAGGWRNWRGAAPEAWTRASGCRRIGS